MKRLRPACLGLMLVAVPSFLAAQQISMDQGVRLAGLWCFPLVTESRQYVYLPAGARLGQDQTGQPQFSFLRYVVNKPGDEGTKTTITAAGGGGVLHFLVLIDTPQEMVDAAQQALRRQLKDDEVVLRGPIVFQDGRYLLVSSILNPAGGPPERKLLASGRAPVLEGNRIAFSFDLKPEETTLLMQSFSMKTPDISLVFDMTFDGLSQAYDADLVIDWSEVRKSEGVSAGASIYFVSADVETMFDELKRNNAIKLQTRGSDSTMEGLLDTVYNKLLDLLFRPVEPEKIPPDKRGGLMDAIEALLDPKGPMSSRKTTGFGAYAGYQLKEMKSSGVSVLSFNHRATVERHSFITFNIGDLHGRYGRDERFFRTVNLSDPAFQQREVHVGIDGALLPEFDKFINTATVTLRKDHQNGSQTLKEVVLDRASLKAESGPRMVYGWNGDEDRLGWLRYDYRTRWSFKGGGSYQTDWIRTDAPMIDLFAPYERRTIQVVGNRDVLQNRKVRAAVVQIEYSFFGEPRRHQLVVRPDELVGEPHLEVTLPLGLFEYDYSITWQLDGALRLNAKGHDGSGLIFVDELPASQAAPGPGGSPEMGNAD